MSNNKPSDLTDKYLANLHQGTKAATQEYARELRHRTTDAEQKLWELIRNRRLKGKKFRRQHAIANYVLIFIAMNPNLQLNWMEIFILKLKQKSMINQKRHC